MFAMEVSVEHDSKTGKIHVVSSVNINPETLQERGLKVYDDGQKSVYALHQDGSENPAEDIKHLTPEEIKELLHQVKDMKMVAEVQYHQPIYSIPYTRSSSVSSPNTTTKTLWQTPTPSPNSLCGITVSRSPQISREDTKTIQDVKGWITPSKTSRHSFTQGSVSRYGEETKITYLHLARLSNCDTHHVSHLHVSEIAPRGLTNSKTHSQSPTSFVSVKARSEGMPLPVLFVSKTADSKVDPYALMHSSANFNRSLPFCRESTTSCNLALLEGQHSEPITMIFMGYERAEDEEEDNIQAELVSIGNSDDGDDESKNVKNESDHEDCLSYHPEGYKSKVFQPKINKAIADCSNIMEKNYTKSNDLGLHQATVIYNPGEHSTYQQGQMLEVSDTGTASINIEKVKLCSTGRQNRPSHVAPWFID